MITLDIAELFYSIQGESTFVGLPCVFIRLAGCNLRCSYCDARYTFEEKSKEIHLDGIHKFIDKFPNALVEITGGEPLLQTNIFKLLDQLILKKRDVLIETNGSIDISPVPPEITIIMDIKCPDSGSGSSFLQPNLSHARRRLEKHPESCEIKFVISTKKDYEWSKNMVLDNMVHPLCPVLFSPVTGAMNPQELAEMILEDQLPVRMQLQLHTFIWPGIVRGV